MEKVSTWRS